MEDDEALRERLRAKYAGIVAANQQQEAMATGVVRALHTVPPSRLQLFAAGCAAGC
jgi:hypothetical protein